MGPLYLGKMGTFVNFRYINNLAGVVILTGVKLRSTQVFPIPVSALECDSYKR